MHLMLDALPHADPRRELNKLVTAPRRALVVGVGNPHRGDDGVGLAVAAAVREQAGDKVETTLKHGDLLELVLDWDDSLDVAVVDAMVSGVEPGSIRVLDALSEVPPPSATMSSHGMGINELIDLAKSLGRMPKSLTVVAVEAAQFGHFDGLTDEVAAAIPRAAEIVLHLLHSEGASE